MSRDISPDERNAVNQIENWARVVVKHGWEVINDEKISPEIKTVIHELYLFGVACKAQPATMGDESAENDVRLLRAASTTKE